MQIFAIFAVLTHISDNVLFFFLQKKSILIEFISTNVISQKEKLVANRKLA